MMTKFEDMKWSGHPLRRRNRIEEALLPVLEKKREQVELPVAPETKRPRLYKAVLLGLLIVAGALALYIYAHREPDVLAEVGKLTTLPVGETPQISTVTDLKPLAGQPFFADAKLGDKVIIYQVAKKAIIYRPSENKIVIVAPIK
jgi:hypothetical protein